MHRSPSANSVLSNGGGAGLSSGSFLPSSSSDPPTPLSSGLPKFAKEFEDVHELLEEPVEEQVGHFFRCILVVAVVVIGYVIGVVVVVAVLLLLYVLLFCIYNVDTLLIVFFNC
jgi:hypothetical protein